MPLIEAAAAPAAPPDAARGPYSPFSAPGALQTCTQRLLAPGRRGAADIGATASSRLGFRVEGLGMRV